MAVGFTGGVGVSDVFFGGDVGVNGVSVGSEMITEPESVISVFVVSGVSGVYLTILPHRSDSSSKRTRPPPKIILPRRFLEGVTAVPEAAGGETAVNPCPQRMQNLASGRLTAPQRWHWLMFTPHLSVFAERPLTPKTTP